MIDIREVKQYNEELKRNKEKSSMLTAQIELYEKELNAKCAELSNELGVTVTKDNLQQIYDEYEKKLQATLETGRAILQKIAQAEAANNMTQQVTSQQQANMSMNAGQQMGMNVGQQMGMGVGQQFSGQTIGNQQMYGQAGVTFDNVGTMTQQQVNTGIPGMNPSQFRV